MEHSAITLDKAQELVRVIGLCGVPVLVRVGEKNPALIKRVMDTGTCGVIVPMVNTKEDAVNAVNAVKYPPMGKRGVGLARAQGYGFKFKEYKDWLAKESVVIAQIEDIRAVHNLKEILTVSGIDAFIVGPYDLSASLGVPGEFGNKKVKAALKEILRVSRSMRKPAGFHVIMPSEKELLERIRQGYRFLGFSLDTIYLGQACADRIANLRKALRSRS
jgi:2-dehydro-3-deoxyglucarate aldolase